MKKLSLIAALLCLVAMLIVPASALEYTIAAPDDYLFAQPTSDDTIYEWENPNVDRGKNAAILPPEVGIPVQTVVAQPVSFTLTAEDLCYPNGSLGTLTIPRLGVNVAIFEGTDSAQLAKGAGHFVGTSIWDGNPCFAAHNRGVNAYFGQIHTLNTGDTIALTTKLGIRTYAVTSVEKVPETDTSGLAASSINQISLYTCVRDQPAYRWCVKGVEIV